jgi:hypothetical protein
MNIESSRRERWIILAWIVVACVLLLLVEPGLRESPYNEF